MGKPLRRSPHLDRVPPSQGRGAGPVLGSTVPSPALGARTSVASDDQTIERLFNEDPRAEPSAKWIANHAAATLEDPYVLNPLIDILLDKVISEPLASVDTKRRPGDFSVRPITTKKPHNLADYETFEDIFDLPTGAAGKAEETEEDDDGPAIEYFLAFAARHAREIIVETLRAEAKHGLTLAPKRIRTFLAELAGQGALEDFAETTLRDLAIAEQFDEYNLIEDLAALSFPEALLARRPDQAARLEKDRAKADRDRPERCARRKRAQAIDTIFQSLRLRPAGSALSDIVLLNEIVACALGVEGLEDDDDELRPLRLIGLLARDERILGLLPKQGQKQLQRKAAHFIHDAEQGDRDATHPLVSLYQRLDRLVRECGFPIRLTIRQDETISVFRPANWPFFLAYALGPGDPEGEDKFEIILTHTEAGADKDPSGPVEIAAGILIDAYRTTYLTAEEFRQGHGAKLMAHTQGTILRLVDAKSFVFHDPDE